MGLTSCKQGTEVDPNDPYNTTKPTQPGTSTKGGDLVFTITKTADLASLWASYDATKKAELMKKTTLNIVINSGSYKLDGGVLTLPKFFNTTANSVLNLTFNGSFQDADKQTFALDASSNLDGAKVNIVLPGQTFNMILDAAKVAATLTSEGAATIGTFKAIANTEKNNALTIGSGVTVNGVDDASTGVIVKNGGDIKALIVNKAPTYKKENGFKIADGETYTKSLIINTKGLTITNDDKTPLGDITINKNCNVKLGFKNATVNSITGTKATESTLTLSGDADDLKNIGAIKNVTIENGGKDLNVNKDIFSSVTINENIALTAAAIADVTLAGNTSIDFNANNMTFAFTSVDFGGAIIPTGGIKTTQTPTKTTYQWDIDKKVWVEVTAAAPITAANAGDSGIEVSSNDVEVKGGAITKGADKVGDHKVFTIVTENSVKLKPENALVTLDKCKKSGADLNDANVSTIFGWTAFGWVGDPWFKVSLNGKSYSWKESTAGYTLIAD
jgi:ribosomal protein L14